MPKYTLTEHARDALAKRAIPLEWMERTLDNPARTEPDKVDADLEHHLAAIPEYQNRVLRVIINRAVDPVKVVTVYFDRKMRNRL